MAETETEGGQLMSRASGATKHQAPETDMSVESEGPLKSWSLWVHENRRDNEQDTSCFIEHLLSTSCYSNILCLATHLI